MNAMNECMNAMLEDSIDRVSGGLRMQARNQKLFRAREVSWNLGTSKNISSKRQEKKAPQGKILEFFSPRYS